MRKTILDCDSTNYDVIDLNTGKSIPLVQWADDETGDYFTLAVDSTGEFIEGPQNQNGIPGITGNLYVWNRGNIKLVKVEHD